jgi:succinate dehydrogenase / fumarate reductase iron-sulfur subunit
MVRLASLEMHPKDVANRISQLHGEAGVALCNITKCCTEVCPEHIKITDNSIIPLKERVADHYFDPIRMVRDRFRPAQPAPRGGGGEGKDPPGLI